MSEEQVKKSRTIRQAKAGLYDEFTKFAGAAAILIAAASNADKYIIITVAAIVGIWCLISIPRWRRVRKYKIEDIKEAEHGDSSLDGR